VLVLGKRERAVTDRKVPHPREGGEKMDEKQRRWWDIEADLDEQHIAQVRFGRRRFLRVLGGGLLSLAAGLAGVQGVAEAKTPATSSPCGPSPLCSSCSGSSNPGTGHSPGTCPTGGSKGGNCWTEGVTRPDGCTDIWKCCDYVDGSGGHCHCTTFVHVQC
jgi:hypothetical protein